MMAVGLYGRCQTYQATFDVFREIKEVTFLSVCQFHYVDLFNFFSERAGCLISKCHLKLFSFIMLTSFKHITHINLLLCLAKQLLMLLLLK
jgi:hypothetical protein